MTQSEFSNQFDILYNNITSNQAAGLNEYEKSVFLTKAQNELMKNYFLSQGNSRQAGFDDNQKRQIDFSKLITISYPSEFNYTAKFDSRGLMYKWPQDVLYVVNEAVELRDGTNTYAERQIIPLDYNEYTRLMSKPYKEPLKYQAWRLIVNVSGAIPSVTQGGDTVVQIILNSKDASIGSQNYQYKLRYVKRPMPIILMNFSTALGEDLTIETYNGSENFYADGTCCELDESIHDEILQRAVELAKVAWEGSVQSVTQAGQRSE